MISVKALEKRAERLFEKADEIQDKWKNNEATEREIRKMNLLYTEASAIAITLEVIDDHDKKSYITVGFGMGGYYAVKRVWYKKDQMWDNCQTSEHVKTWAKAVKTAQDWAKAEGIECHA